MNEATFTSRFTPHARAGLRVGEWRPAPLVEDRAAWAHISEDDRERLLAAADDWRAQATAEPTALHHWARYSSTGERQPYERTQRALLGLVATSAMALGVTDDDAHAVALADGIWRLCEQSSWCLPSHYALPESGERPFLPVPGREVLDLHNAAIGAMLAAIDAFAGARIETLYPGFRARVHHEIRTRVLGPWEDDVYFWHGLDAPPNNWAPWIVSNVLVCAAVVESDRAALERTVDRALGILDRFRAGYDADGSCDEGATYWWWAGATLFEGLDLLEEITGGAFDGFSVAPVAAMARFPMTMQIGPDAQVNYSDALPLMPENATWNLLARFGRRVGDEQVVRHARWMGRRTPLAFDRQLAPLFRRTLAELRAPGWTEGDAGPGMPATVYLPGTEILVARDSDGATDGFVLAAKGGHNDVSHNHNDAGALTVSLDGEPVLIDAGVGVYDRWTFEPSTRYTIWTMRSAWHSVPLPGDVEQAFGRSFAAAGTRLVEEEDRVGLTMDLATAYPPESGLVRTERRVALDRAAGAVLLRDEWEFDAPRTMTLVLMTAAEPVLLGEGRLRVGPAEILVEDIDALFEIDRIDLDDARRCEAWGEAVFRIRIVQRAAGVTGACGVRIERATA